MEREAGGLRGANCRCSHLFHSGEYTQLFFSSVFLLPYTETVINVFTSETEGNKDDPTVLHPGPKEEEMGSFFHPYAHALLTCFFILFLPPSICTEFMLKLLFGHKAK